LIDDQSKRHSFDVVLTLVMDSESQFRWPAILRHLFSLCFCPYLVLSVVCNDVQVGPVIETLTSRKGELLELAPVAHGIFGSGQQQDSNLPSLQEAACASGAAATAASSDRQRLVFEVMPCLEGPAHAARVGCMPKPCIDRPVLLVEP
jgi:hypothetical protein